MKIPTITINAAVAKNELQVIHNHPHAREYADAKEAYKWASAGFDLIDLSEVFADAPLDQEGRPRLAVARADWKEVQLWRFDQRFTFSRWPKQRSLFRRPLSYTFRTNQYVMSGLAYALAPIIPPIYRPQGSLKEYHILWEVEAWSNTPAGVQADEDPYLLKHITGDLYAVIAQWDLTPLERAITAGRRSN